MEDYNPLGIYEPTRAVPDRQLDRGTLVHSRTLTGGRLSRDKDADFYVGAFSIFPPASPEMDWNMHRLDSKMLRRMSAARLLELLQDFSPEVSRGLWDFLRMCNSGVEITASNPNTGKPYKRGQQAVDGFLKILKGYYGSVDVLYHRLFFSAWLRGAVFSELVLNKEGRLPIDIATPDPWTARFRRIVDEERGYIWELGQWQKGEFVSLNRETIQYVPIDPFPNSPYGRPMVSPALFGAMFLMGLLHDLKRVVEQQGYPRLDISVDLSAMRESMPDSIKQDPAKFKAWVDSAIAEIADYYSKLEPDDAYVHTSPIAVNRPVGAVDARSLGAVDGLLRALDRMLFRALKTMPLLMGSNEATSETHANRQWEIHVASIRAIQHPVETVLGRFFELGLQAQGIAASVKVEFAELRASEEMRDAQVQQLKLKNARTAYDNGLINQDEQATMALGKDKADQAAPRAAADTALIDLAPIDESASRNRGRNTGDPHSDAGEEDSFGWPN
jgi:hypothetical protein